MAKATVVLVGTADGLVQISDPGGIGRWLRVGHELRGQAIRSAWLEYANPLVGLAATDNGVFRSDNGGQSWQPTLHGAGAALAGGGRTAPTTMVALVGGALHRSDDAGATWQPAEAPWADATLLALDAADPQRLAVASGSAVWHSEDGGTRWLVVDPAPQPVQSLLVADGRLVALGNDTVLVWDSAAGWQKQAPVSGTILAGLAGKTPVLLCGGASGIARSENNGTTWQAADIPESAAITALVPGRYNIDLAFAGTAEGHVLLSADRGRTWQPLRRESSPILSLAAARLA